MRAGLNIGLSGIPWWTSDIGGFHGGDPESPYFRELIVRWFQYGVFCPLFRLHGMRQPTVGWDAGGPNEVWSFGDEAYAIIRDLLFLRERLKPYILAQMAAAAETGTPPMRPLFFDFPDDPACYERRRPVHVRAGHPGRAGAGSRARRAARSICPRAEWYDAWTGEAHAGGVTLTAAAPLARIPVYVRDRALLALFRS